MKGEIIMSCKICIIGAGSAIFSLNLVKDICINKHFARLYRNSYGYR